MQKIRGDIIQEYITQNDMTIINDPRAPYIYHLNNRKGTLDLKLCGKHT